MTGQSTADYCRRKMRQEYDNLLTVLQHGVADLQTMLDETEGMDVLDQAEALEVVTDAIRTQFEKQAHKAHKDALSACYLRDAK